MRYGFTTGSCAAAAAKAAAYMLLTGREKTKITIETPKGIPYTAQILRICRKEREVSCAVEKDGKRLTICWLTYPSRQELPLLAESAQASLKKIGIEVQIQCTANHLELLKKGNWDVYVSAFVSAPTGDPEYFFTTHCLQDSSKNRGGYYSETLEMLEQQLSGEFDTEKRTELAIEMTQMLLDDHMFFFTSHLKMSMVSGEGVTGLTAHPCDYYEITVNLDKNK